MSKQYRFKGYTNYFCNITCVKHLFYLIYQKFGVYSYHGNIDELVSNVKCMSNNELVQHIFIGLDPEFVF